MGKSEIMPVSFSSVALTVEERKVLYPTSKFAAICGDVNRKGNVSLKKLIASQD